MNPPNMMAPATPAADPRPTNGASANATAPAAIAEQEERDGVARRHVERDLVAGQPVDRSPHGEQRDEDDERDDRLAGQVGEQLLEGHPSPRDRRRGDQLHASAPSLGREGRREGEDRPEADDDREEASVLVLEVATERADIDRLAGEPRQDRGHGRDDRDELRARSGRVELTDDRKADADQEQAEQDRDDEDRTTRVAHGLAVDAAEPVDAGEQRRPGDGRRDGRGPAFDFGGHVRRPRSPRPYWARNVSSSDGSRLTKSSRS